jgi:hypothetical protein
MHQVYRAAERVWVWLGDVGLGERSTTRAIAVGANGNDCDDEIEQERNFCKEAVALLPRIAGAGEAIYQKGLRNLAQSPRLYNLPPLTSPLWNSIYALLVDNPWFCRLWIVQEAAFARRISVLFGEHEVNWDVLGRAINRWSNLKQSLVDSYGTKLKGRGFEYRFLVFFVRDTVQGQQPWEVSPRVREEWPVHIIRIISATASGHHCYNPRDRILRILGFYGMMNGELGLLGIKNR